MTNPTKAVRLASMEARLRDISADVNALQTIIRLKLPRDELNELHRRKATWDLYMALTAALNTVFGALSGNPNQVEAVSEIDLPDLIVRLPKDVECMQILLRLATSLHEVMGIVLSLLRDGAIEIKPISPNCRYATVPPIATTIGTKPRVMCSGVFAAGHARAPAAGKPDPRTKATG